METLESFKAAQGVEHVEFRQGEKRMWGMCGNKRLIVKPGTDPKDTLFVTRITEDSEGNAITDEVYVVFNVKSEVVFRA